MRAVSDVSASPPSQDWQTTCHIHQTKINGMLHPFLSLAAPLPKHETHHKISGN
jgi:hypothetical protein